MKISAQLQQKLNNLRNEAEALNTKEGVTVEEIKAKAEEIKVAKAQLDSQLEIENQEDLEFQNKVQNGGAKVVEGTVIENQVDTEKQYKNAFYNALRGKRVSNEDMEVLTKVNATIDMQINNALSSGSAADGGYLIPIDQRTAIIELKRQFQALEPLVNVEPVSTLTGNRNIEKEAEYTPFTEFTEGNDVPDAGSPQFVNIAYGIKDRGGFLPVPNNLLNDNTANLEAYLNRWLAKKEVATRNKLIIDLLGTLTKTAITGIDDVKNVLNVTLDPSIAVMSIVVMNQDSFNKFDKMKDSQGNYLLEKDPKNPTQKLLGGKPVYVFSNKILKTRIDGTKKLAPVIMGSLTEAVTLFDRQAMSLLSTNIGGDAFKKNRTDIRAITREDVQFVDKNAVVFGEIEVQ